MVFVCLLFRRFVQTFALFKHMRLRFPHRIWMLMSAFAIANFDVDILRTPCVLGAVHPLSNVRPCTAGVHVRLARPAYRRFPLAAGSLRSTCAAQVVIALVAPLLGVVCYALLFAVWRLTVYTDGAEVRLAELNQRPAWMGRAARCKPRQRAACMHCTAAAAAAAAIRCATTCLTSSASTS